MKIRWLVFVLLLLLIVAIYFIVRYTDYQKPTKKKEGQAVSDMKITSSAFEDKKRIPSKYTCNGENINPPLEFSDVPKEAKSLVLIVDDPDAPMGTWVHWVVYDISPAVREVKENSITDDGVEGMTSFGKPGYGGPCPPSGTHRYFFKLYALNKKLSLGANADKETVLQNMKDSIIAQSELVGLYSQKK